MLELEIQDILIAKEEEFNTSLRNSLGNKDNLSSDAEDDEQLVEQFRANVEFSSNIQLKLLMSDYYLVRLKEAYLERSKGMSEPKMVNKRYNFRMDIGRYKCEIEKIGGEIVDLVLGRPSSST